MRRGFTIVELAIVVAIIGIIAAIIGPSILTALQVAAAGAVRPAQVEATPAPPPPPARFTRDNWTQVGGGCCTTEITALCDTANGNLIYVMSGYDGRGAIQVVPGGCK